MQVDVFSEKHFTETQNTLYSGFIKEETPPYCDPTLVSEMNIPEHPINFQMVTSSRHENWEKVSLSPSGQEEDL